MLDEGETCDPPETCPASCDDGLACTIDELTGSAAYCSAACSTTTIVACASGDGCCPVGCDEAADADCACGNGVLDEGESCDPPETCPTSCDDADPCTVDELVGQPESCTASCEPTPITECLAGDGCCPSGCSADEDEDCGSGAGASSGAESGSSDESGGCGCSTPGRRAAGPGGLALVTLSAGWRMSRRWRRGSAATARRVLRTT